jgi:adenylate cyclase
MGKEIERKFLVKNDDWKNRAEAYTYKQGYLSIEEARNVRIRIIGTKGFLTLKGKSIGAERLEFEYEIPLEDAKTILGKLCILPLIEKTRYKLCENNLLWEIDVFEGINKGLILAEVELTNENQKFKKPEWLGEEVTYDPKYYNSNLVNKSCSSWDK